MARYEIFEGNMERLEKKLNLISKKCSKYGCEFHYHKVGETFRELKDEQGNIYTAKFIVVEAEGTAKVNDWEFIASVEHTEKGNILNRVGEIEVPERYYTSTPICEHCNSHRYRKYTYIVRNAIISFFYSCFVMFHSQDYTYLGTFISEASDVLKTCVFGYFVKAGVENVTKIVKSKNKSESEENENGQG